MTFWIARLAVITALSTAFAASADFAKPYSFTAPRVGDRLPASPAPATKEGARFKTLDWEALVPKDWDPLAGVDRQAVAKMQDRDPGAAEVFAKLKAAGRMSPTVPTLANRRVRISGYYIPLAPEGESSRDFLLVPYFGACIHNPPPPSNQMIHVTLPQATDHLRLMDALVVTGTLKIERSESAMGVAAYRLIAVNAAPHETAR